MFCYQIENVLFLTDNLAEVPSNVAVEVVDETIVRLFSEVLDEQLEVYP